RGRTALAFCHHKPTKVFFIFPLAITDFYHHDWQNAELWFTVVALEDVLEGVRALHLAKWMHLDLTPKNLLLMSTKTARANVTDFGKAVHAQTDTNTYLCPPAYQAPEVNGNPYTNTVDCYNMGLVFCFIIIPTEFAEIMKLRDFQKDTYFYYRMELALQSYGEKGPIQQCLAEIAEGLIAYDPDDRCSINQALIELPRWDKSEQLFKWRSGQTFALPKETTGPATRNADSGGGGHTHPQKKRARKNKVGTDVHKTGGQARQEDEAGYEGSDELKHKKPGKVVFSISGKD
ncbi:MAG: hypothetical protein Q9183_006966, partial [Haloplaca sp. 2 TL-2023]